MEVVQSHLRRRREKEDQSVKLARGRALREGCEQDSPVKVEDVDVVGPKLLERVSELINPRPKELHQRCRGRDKWENVTNREMERFLSVSRVVDSSIGSLGVGSVVSL